MPKREPELLTESLIRRSDDAPEVPRVQMIEQFNQFYPDKELCPREMRYSAYLVPVVPPPQVRFDDLTLGYNLALATTATRIRAVIVATGATADNEAAILLAQQQLAAQQPLPPYLWTVPVAGANVAPALMSSARARPAWWR